MFYFHVGAIYVKKALMQELPLQENYHIYSIFGLIFIFTGTESLKYLQNFIFASIHFLF